MKNLFEMLFYLPFFLLYERLPDQAYSALIPPSTGLPILGSCPWLHDRRDRGWLYVPVTSPIWHPLFIIPM